ncbi:MAG TPA: hypothetical protein VFQ40_08080, partial [Actinomycetota bacterium]|nr:hypothetical protein [Actinomycetota bacterium]
MRRGVSRRAAVALLLAVPVATGSCAPRTLRADLLERRLARRLEDTLEVSGILVSCPDGVEVERGV